MYRSQAVAYRFHQYCEKESGIRGSISKVPFLLVQRHLAVPNAARCGGDFRFALCEGGNPDGFPLTLLFPSDPLGLRAASLRSKLVSLPGPSPGNAAFPPHTPLSFRTA